MMLFALFFVFGSKLASAAITDTNCTDGTNWVASAFNCDDVQASAFCTKTYAIGSNPAPAVGNANERVTTCFSSDGTAVDPAMRDGAVATCPKTCGYCCITPAFTCTNKEFPRVNCKTVTQKQCTDSKWREILADDCPNVCGFCLDGGCVDAAIECANDVSICRNVDTQDFVKINCKKTCGYCTSSTTGTAGTGSTRSSCTDDAKCSSWIANGFCTSSFYTEDVKRYYCPKACGKC
ncbi:unnamed protein product, partial [Mesorhabditis belari]|uniref:ShKT domain-containing protein n=1 Tax=Mesorhabditis belari TaxID=2138241 RepID=A0AAF3EIE9_9BILA